MVLISLSEVTTYFPFPAEEDRVDYAIVPVDNGMTWVLGPTSAFLMGRLLRVIKNNVTNIVLPSAFRLDAEAQDFHWVPHLIQGNVWANYLLIDPDNEGDENFTHMFLLAPLDVFRMDQGDQV